MGKNMLRLLKFVIRYRGWQTYGKDRSTVQGIQRLARLGLVEVNEFRQFRLTHDLQPPAEVASEKKTAAWTGYGVSKQRMK